MISATATSSSMAAAAAAANSSRTPCAGCKLLRRKCQSDCIFAPHFPPEQPQKFHYVHKVFGASNVTKILGDLPQPYREDAATSLAYEAEMRIRDPVFGCVSVIIHLKQQLQRLMAEYRHVKMLYMKYQSTINTASGRAGGGIDVEQHLLANSVVLPKECYPMSNYAGVAARMGISEEQLMAYTQNGVQFSV